MVYVVAGPNGAGKTTFAREFLPNFAHCEEFLNADLIAAGLSPFAPSTQDARAAELMLLRMDECIRARQSFGFETTLSGRSHVGRLEGAKAQGYAVTTFFLWLPDVTMALARVAQRVAAGGHFVPDETVRARYEKGLANFRDLYRGRSDAWYFYDGSTLPPTMIAKGTPRTCQVVNEMQFPNVVAWLGEES
jgi:predicted ABC-type ATPase